MAPDNILHPKEGDYRFELDFSHIRYCYALGPLYSCRPCTFGEQEPNVHPHQLHNQIIHHLGSTLRKLKS